MLIYQSTDSRSVYKNNRIVEIVQIWNRNYEHHKTSLKIYNNIKIDDSTLNNKN